MSNIEEIKGKRTLVYFASGPYKTSYEYLPFDQIYLVDYCFASRDKTRLKISESGKVICLGMDCLQSVDYLKHLGVKIDCLVVLNEGLFEGGGHYAINSDMVISYIMPILKTEYLHILNKSYYGNLYKVSLDLPYDMSEIREGEIDYLNPLIFSSNEYNKGSAKMYRMTKRISEKIIPLNPKIQLSLIHDSIWNYVDNLDLLALSITPQGQEDFFQKVNKVVSLRDLSVEQILEFCVLKKIEKIGFTPWSNGKYSSFIDQIQNYSKDYPKSISLFHLNKNDFKSLREIA